MDALNVSTTLQGMLSTATPGGSNNGGGRYGGAAKGGDTTYTHYCWPHSPKSNYKSAQCTRKATGHKETDTNANKMGGHPTKWKCYGACENRATGGDKLTNNISSNIAYSNISVIADSGCTNHYLCANAPHKNNQSCSDGV